MTRRRRIILATGSALALGLAALGLSQIEGGDRGVPPIDSSANYEIGGIQVDVAGKTAQQARMVGWRVAQRRGWAQLWAKANGLPEAQAPHLSDGQLDQIVAGVSVEDEEIGAHRYIARLGVLFDRARAGDLLGAHGGGPRSAPTLVIPVMWSGGVAQSFEHRTDWQKAWARFRSGGSAIDYVRPVGTGMDPLLLNVAQAGRPGRRWWRMILDQYGASDVVIPTVRIERRFPGGPVVAHFIAYHGPDSAEVTRFDLAARDSSGMARMLDEGVRRIDEAYAGAFRAGGLIADPTLVEEPAVVPELEAVEPTVEETGATTALPTPASGPIQTFTIQVETPDAASQGALEQALRSLLGVRSATTPSLALGGVSLMRVEFAGDAAALRAAAFAAGLQLRDENGTLRLRRTAP